MTSEELKKAPQRKDLELFCNKGGSFQGGGRKRSVFYSKDPTWGGALAGESLVSLRSRPPAQETQGTMADREVEGPLSPPEKSCDTGTGSIKFLIKKINSRAIIK